jgi:hypothetical protein
MELKNVNPNGNNVVASNVNNINFFFLKNVKIEIKKKHDMLYFLQDIKIARKTKFLIFFTPLINIQRIKASLANMDLFHKKRIIIIINF